MTGKDPKRITFAPVRVCSTKLSRLRVSKMGKDCAPFIAPFLASKPVYVISGFATA